MAIEDVRGPLEGCVDGLGGFAEASREGEENVAGALGHFACAVTALEVAQEELAAAGVNLHDADFLLRLSNARARTVVLHTEKVDTQASDNPTIRTLPAFVIPLERDSRGTVPEIARAQQITEGHTTVVANLLEELKRVVSAVSNEQKPLTPRAVNADAWAEKIREYLNRM